jgi:predicted extracellular nuclease
MSQLRAPVPTSRSVRSSRLGLAGLLLLASAALAACGGGGGQACTPECPADQCLECQDGLCVSTCEAGEVCRAGVCQSATCDPACETSQCQTCVAGQCVSACGPTEGCVAGVCLPIDTSCDPACDASLCLACQNGRCESVCTEGASCQAGVCVAGGGCEPACDGNACQVCVDGSCVSTCGAGKECVAGLCITPSVCTPACDAAACQVCDDGACVSLCRVGERCIAGACQPSSGLTVFDIQDPTRPAHPAENSAVTLADVVVTAIDTRTADSGSFWVQDPIGGPYSGVKIFNKNGAVDVSALAVGARVTVSGTYKEFYDLTEIDLTSVELLEGTLQPVVTTVDPAAVANDGAQAEAFEGVLVRIVDVTVTNANPDGPGQDFGEFQVTGGLRVDDDLFVVSPDPVEGDTFASLTGVLTWGFENRKLLPRSAADVVTGGGGCTPACDADACRVCRDGQCVSSCGEGEVCVNRQCQPRGGCDPACEPLDCQLCIDDRCVSACGDGQTCAAGVCRSTGGLTVADVRNPASPDHPAENSDVTLEDVVVTAIDTLGSGAGSFWVQDAGGGPWSGIKVFNRNTAVDVSGLAVGDRVSVTGAYIEYYGLSEIAVTAMQVLALPAQQPAVTTVDPAAVATGGADAEAFESVLVRVADVTVTSENPDAPGNFGEFAVTGGLRVDDDLFDVEPHPAVGERFTGITGVMSWSFENRKLLPRSVADVQREGDVCAPACDAQTCQICVAGTCRSACTAGQTCVNGSCQGGGGAITVYDVQDATRPNHPAVGSAVTVSGVVVTAIDRLGGGSGSFWVQETAGGPWSGIRVFPGALATTDLAVGDVVTVRGTYEERFECSQIAATSIEETGTAAAPAPATVAAGDLATGGAQAEPYEGVLVQVTNVIVTNANPDGPASDFGEFAVTGGLRIGDDLYVVTPDPQVGDTFERIAGVLHFDFSNTKVLPRSAADVVAGGAATCTPACDAQACQACVGGQCVSFCNAGETCLAGVCQAGSGEYSVYELQDEAHPGHPAVGSAVTLEDVIITAIDRLGTSGGLWVQEQAGGPYSGIRVFPGSLPTTDLAVGQHVTVRGTYEERYGLTQVAATQITALPLAPTVLAPADVDPAAVATGGPQAEAYEGVLVRVQNVTVTDANPDAPADHGEFVVTGGLRVDDDLFVITPDPVVGDTFASLTGVLTYTFDNVKLEPRVAADVVAGGGPVTCDPPCSASACRTCVAGRCVSTCDPGEVCNAGVCELGSGDCLPPCDPANCEVCIEGACYTSCELDEYCNAGTCEWNGAHIVTVYDLQDETSAAHPSPESVVILEDVVITAIDKLNEPNGTWDLWVQEPAGGPFSGIMIYNPAIDVTGLTVGHTLILAGVYREYNGLSQIELLDGAVYDLDPVLLTPAALAAADIATGGALAEPYEGVLVRIEDVAVTDANPDAPSDFGEFVVTGGLRVDDTIYRIEPDPVLGDTFQSIAGVLHYSFSNTKLLPRDAADVIPGDAIPCVPACPVGACQACVAGQCVSLCDPDACEACDGGVCASTCEAGETCDAGTCVPVGDTVTIQAVQQGIIPPCSTGCPSYVIRGLVVTAIDTRDVDSGTFYVMDPAGGTYSGALVTPYATATVTGVLSVGARVDLVFEVRQNAKGTNLRASSVTVTGSGAVPAPVVIAVPASIATGGALAEAYEGVLVRVESVTVTDANPDVAAGDYNEFVVDGLRVDDELVAIEPDPQVGDTFTSITGVVRYSYSNFKLLPRTTADIVRP